MPAASFGPREHSASHTPAQKIARQNFAASGTVNKTVSAIGGLFVILVAVVFIVQFRPGSGGASAGSSGPTCAVEIQGGCIQTTHYWAAYRLVGGGFEQSYLRSMGVRRLVTDGLIERYLLTEDAKRLGVGVSEEEVTSELVKGRAYVSLPAEKEREVGYYLGLLAPAGQRRVVWETPFRVLQVKNSKTKAFETKTYEKTIRNVTKMSPTDFRDFQREEMVAARMRDLIKSRVHVAEAEGFDDYARRKSTVTLNYIKLDRNFYADLYVDKDAKVIDEWIAKNTEEINKAWESRKAQYEGGECRVARHILAKFPEGADDEQKAKAKKRIDKAAEALKKGDDFGAVARRFSEDGSATKDGELGCVPRKMTVKPFEDALFAMEEGKASDVVTTEYGYHLIKLEKIAKGDALEKVVKAQIGRDLYLKFAAEAKAAEGGKAIHAAVKGGKSLEEALKTHLDELAASAAKGDKKDAAKPEEKKEEKKDDAKKDEPSADDVVENKPFTAENHPDRPLAQTTAPFNMSGNPMPDAMEGVELVKEAFKLQKAGDTTANLVALRGGYAIVTLKEKTPVKKEEWEKDREETLSAIRKTKQIEALVLYLQRLRQRAERETPIKRNDAITNEPPEEKGGEPAPEDESPEP
ncbi:MAG: peptidylprolyl isomerase [Polyangiaceae bacterium]|nr:peptidylprolyl isomerase [Polyangiaceae bacterium]